MKIYQVLTIGANHNYLEILDNLEAAIKYREELLEKNKSVFLYVSDGSRNGFILWSKLK